MCKTLSLLFSTACLVALLCSCDKTRETEIPVETVSLSQPMAEMLVGESIQLVAIITPKQATDQTVIWASSKPSVAIVSDDGIVTALAEGVTTILANAGGKSASCTVTVTSSSSSDVSVTGVTLDKTSLTLVVGEKATLKATVKPDNAPNKQVSWSSSSTGIATVDGNGTVTAKAVGSATITVTTKDGGFKANCDVIVTSQSTPSSGSFKISGWQLNPDCILGKKDKLNFTKPSSSSSPSPYNQYGAVLSNSTRINLMSHFKEFAVDANDKSLYTFKLMNYKRDIVDFDSYYNYVSDDNGYATLKVRGSDLNNIRYSGLYFYIYLVNGYKGSNKYEVLIEVSEENVGDSYSVTRGYYYLVFDEYSHYSQNSSYLPPSGVSELGTFVDCIDYLLLHELMPKISFNNGPTILAWDYGSNNWRVTKDGQAAGYSADRFSFHINKLLFDKNAKDTYESFNGLWLFNPGTSLNNKIYVLECGIVWDPRDFALTSEKVAGYELEVFYNGDSLMKKTGEIKILPSGKKAHPYHHQDGSVWE